jgi:hypothetical protein
MLKYVTTVFHLANENASREKAMLTYPGGKIPTSTKGGSQLGIENARDGENHEMLHAHFCPT